MKKLHLNANLPESVSFELNNDYYRPEPIPNLEYSRFSDVVDITGLSDDEVAKLERDWFVDKLMETYFYSEVKWGIKMNKVKINGLVNGIHDNNVKSGWCFLV